MLVRLTLLLILTACALPIADAQALTPPEQTQPSVGQQLALKTRDLLGLDKLKDASTLHFRWTHSTGKSRAYTWNLRADTVEVDLGKGDKITIPAAGGDKMTETQTQAHQAFINDHYWLLFELLITKDKSLTLEPISAEALSAYKIPGATQGLRVKYPKGGGYTPGDHYVLALGEDGKPVGWAYHRAGSEGATLVTTRAAYKKVAGISLPTEFKLLDGVPFITISEIEIK